MEYFTEDLWTMVLARLPLKIFTCFKIVCKQWKSIVESSFFRDLFISLHQNSPSSSWSLMYCKSPHVVAHYECDTWGLNRYLDSFINSLPTDKSEKYKYTRVDIEAYSDVGLILIHAKPTTIKGYGVLYVANPVSRECVEISFDDLPVRFETGRYLLRWGIATRIESGVLLGYKVVVFDTTSKDTKLMCLIYSSETGLWSLETSCLNYCMSRDSISLNGNLHWLARNNDNDNQEVVLSMDFYATSTVLIDAVLHLSLI